jgi:hypothetical protein
MSAGKFYSTVVILAANFKKTSSIFNHLKTVLGIIFSRLSNGYKQLKNFKMKKGGL